MSDKLRELGIPPSDITPAVSIALNGLTDHIEQLNAELQNTKQQLENLQDLIDVDSSPALPNRRAFIKRIDWAIAMNKRYSDPTSIVIFKLSDFETINRTYGYQAASRAAGYVAEYLAANVRDTDFFARINETQFGALMFFAEVDDIREKVSRMRGHILQNPMRWNNGVINIPLSCGLHRITSADTPESAILAATNAVFTDQQKQKFEEINIKA